MSRQHAACGYLPQSGAGRGCPSPRAGFVERAPPVGYTDAMSRTVGHLRAGACFPSWGRGRGPRFLRRSAREGGRAGAQSAGVSLGATALSLTEGAAAAYTVVLVLEKHHGAHAPFAVQARDDVTECRKAQSIDRRLVT